jgi:hypothetical protein
MKKLLRFTILAMFSVLLYIILYSIIPFISWIFGGDFYEVCQHPAYIITFGLALIPVIIGNLLETSYDKNFLPKH